MFLLSVLESKKEKTEKHIKQWWTLAKLEFSVFVLNLEVHTFPAFGRESGLFNDYYQKESQHNNTLGHNRANWEIKVCPPKDVIKTLLYVWYKLKIARTQKYTSGYRITEIYNDTVKTKANIHGANQINLNSLLIMRRFFSFKFVPITFIGKSKKKKFANSVTKRNTIWSVKFELIIFYLSER